MNRPPELSMLGGLYQRWAVMEDERRELSDDLKELFAEGKGEGLNPKAMRAAFAEQYRLDTQTQAEIVGNLRKAMEGRTTMIISQRISTIKDLDQILVLDNGRITERGNHQTLLNGNGLYASMYRRELLSQELEES